MHTVRWKFNFQSNHGPDLQVVTTTEVGVARALMRMLESFGEVVWAEWESPEGDPLEYFDR